MGPCRPSLGPAQSRAWILNHQPLSLKHPQMWVFVRICWTHSFTQSMHMEQFPAWIKEEERKTPVSLFGRPFGAFSLPVTDRSCKQT